VQILTKRCILTLLSESDFEELTPLITNETVRRYLGGVRPLESSLNGWLLSIQSLDEYIFAVRLQISSVAVGLVTLAQHHNQEDMEISFMFLPEYWGNGYAREAVGVLLKFSECELQLSRVVSETQAANIRSRSMLEKLGYTLESEVERFGEKQYIYVFKNKLL